jgi:hypothetical protein
MTISEQLEAALRRWDGWGGDNLAVATKNAIPEIKAMEERLARVEVRAQAAINAIVRSTEYDTVPHEAELALALHNLRAALAPEQPREERNDD